MAISKNRVKVVGTGGDVGAPFALGAPVASFAAFPDGLVRYIVVSATGDWQIGQGTVTGSTLTRGTVEENHLGTTAQINFTGETIQIAQILSVALINAITDKLDGIDNNAADDQSASEVPFTPAGSIGSDNVQGALENLDSRVNSHTQNATSIVYDPADDPVTAAIEAQTALEDHGKAIQDLSDKTYKHMGVTAPVDPVDGQEWLNTDTMKEYTWYIGALNSQWVRNI